VRKEFELLKDHPDVASKSAKLFRGELAFARPSPHPLLLKPKLATIRLD
jgi:hypothetical protein